MHPSSVRNASALEELVLQCTRDIPTLCVECQERVVQLTILGQYQRVYHIMLTKEMEGTILLDAESHINLDLTIGSLLDSQH